jgi:hypothetical protein
MDFMDIAECRMRLEEEAQEAENIARFMDAYLAGELAESDLSCKWPREVAIEIDDSDLPF